MKHHISSPYSIQDRAPPMTTPAEARAPPTILPPFPPFAPFKPPPPRRHLPVASAQAASCCHSKSARTQQRNIKHKSLRVLVICCDWKKLRKPPEETGTRADACIIARKCTSHQQSRLRLAHYPKKAEGERERGNAEVRSCRRKNFE